MDAGGGRHASVPNRRSGIVPGQRCRSRRRHRGACTWIRDGVCPTCSSSSENKPRKSRSASRFSEPPRSGGVVRDVAGVPVPGCTIVAGSLDVASRTTASLGPNAESTMSAENGVFKLSGLSAGKNLVIAHKPGYVEWRRVLETEVGTALHWDIELRGAARLRGLVVDEGGKSVSSAMVTCFRERTEVGFVRTDADGRFELGDLDSVEHSLWVAHREFGWCHLTIDVDAIQNEGLLTVRLRQGLGVGGMTTDERGWPVPEARVSLEVRDQSGCRLRWGGSFRSGGEGRFVITEHRPEPQAVGVRCQVRLCVVVSGNGDRWPYECSDAENSTGLCGVGARAGSAGHAPGSSRGDNSRQRHAQRARHVYGQIGSLQSWRLAGRPVLVHSEKGGVRAYLSEAVQRCERREPRRRPYDPSGWRCRAPCFIELE